MTSSFVSRILTPAAFVCLMAATSVAGAAPADQPRSDARSSDQGMVKALMRHGLSELKQGNLEGARSAFAKAYEVDPQPTVALSLAEVETKLGLYQEAAEHWVVFLQHAPPDNSERAAAHDQLAECRRHLGRVKIVVSSAPAELLVDDRVVGTAPLLEEIWLSPGEHTFSVRSRRGQAAPQKATIARGEMSTIQFNLEPSSQSSSAPASQPSSASEGAAPASSPLVSVETDRPVSSSSARTPVLIAGGALTAVALGAGVFFTISANAAASDVEDLQYDTQTQGDPDFVETGSQCSPGAPMRPAACDDLTARIEDHDTSKTLAIGSFIGAGVLGAATLTTYLLWPTEKKETARVEVGPWALPGGKGVQARFTF